MPGLEEEWHAEGISDEQIAELFALSDSTGRTIGINTGFYPPVRSCVVHEDEDFRVEENEFGGVSKLSKKCASIPITVEFPVRSEQDWLRVKPRFQWDAERLAPDWLERARRDLSDGQPLEVWLTGFYAFPRLHLGDLALCCAYYDRPELVHDMCRTQCELAVKAADAIERSGVAVDKVCLWEDMAGRQGPMISPRLFREFMFPYYREVICRYRRLGAYHFEVDTDGNANDLLPLFIEAGVTCLFPFECQAGMDVVEARGRYPQLVIHGGIDKRTLTAGREAIDRELDRKLPPLMAAGGYMCAADHRLLRGTTFEAVSHFMRSVAERIGKTAKGSMR